MKAITITNPASIGSLSLVDLPDVTVIQPHHIVVRLHASSVNFHDYLVVTGSIPVENGRIPMSDGAGEVIAVGDAVMDFAIGDHVVSTFHTRWPAGKLLEAGNRRVPGDGIDGYARQEIAAPAEWFTRAPRSYSHAEAATLTCAGVTAWRALATDGPTIAGQTVLVQGSGGVSIFALQFAKAMGATVIATSSSDAKLERLRALGADHVINYKEKPEWGRVAFELCGGVDHVIEVGGPATLPQSIAAIGMGGHIALIGVLTGRSGEIPTSMLMGKQGRLQGITVGSRRDQLDMIAAINVAKFQPVIDRVFPLEELGAAFRYQEQGIHFGKISIDIA